MHMENHDNNNPKCPHNDPETFANPATGGLACTCESQPKSSTDATAEASKGPQEINQLLREVQEKYDRIETRQDEIMAELSGKLEQLNAEGDAIKELAQAALDIVVGFRIRARGGVVQLGVLERMLVVNDLETAKAFETIVKYAEKTECQGLDLLTPFDVNDDPPAGGIFGPPAVEVTNNTLEGQMEGRDREAFDQGYPRAAKPNRVK
jgi:hypothetical protein